MEFIAFIIIILGGAFILFGKIFAVQRIQNALLDYLSLEVDEEFRLIKKGKGER